MQHSRQPMGVLRKEKKSSELSCSCCLALHFFFLLAFPCAKKKKSPELLPPHPQVPFPAPTPTTPPLPSLPRLTSFLLLHLPSRRCNNIDRPRILRAHPVQFDPISSPIPFSSYSFVHPSTWESLRLPVASSLPAFLFILGTLVANAPAPSSFPNVNAPLLSFVTGRRPMDVNNIIAYP